MLFNFVAIVMTSCKSWPMRIIKHEMAHSIKQISKSMGISWLINGNFMVENWEFYVVDEIWWICDAHGSDRLVAINMHFSNQIGEECKRIGMADVKVSKIHWRRRIRPAGKAWSKIVEAQNVKLASVMRNQAKVTKKARKYVFLLFSNPPIRS